MRKVTFSAAISLDNYIAGPNGAVDWIMWSDEAAEVMKDYWTKIDTFVMGRKTFDFAMQNAPKSKGKKSKNPFAGMNTYVFSKTLVPGEQNGVAILSEDPGEFLRKLKKQEGREICVMGGGEFARPLFEASVIDEIGFNIHPILLGSGIPLYHAMNRRINLELIECRPFKNGCVHVLYKVKN